MMERGGLETRITRLADVQPYKRGIYVTIIVLERGLWLARRALACCDDMRAWAGSSRQTRERGTVQQLLVADRSASITMSMFGAQGEVAQPGDILQLENGFAGHRMSLCRLPPALCADTWRCTASA